MAKLAPAFGDLVADSELILGEPVLAKDPPG